ncbi:MAG: FAD/NAD(P)-binding protein [Caulobacter sp.]|nr:FAD/NAD(P)-binding protein [Caulobacter sp.]
MSETDGPGRHVAIIGGGFSGSLLALKLTARRPDWLITLIDPAVRPGRGLAYGACEPYHLLNVPAHRMEVGLEPGFQAWLQTSGQDLDQALLESDGSLADAFLPRRLLGDYLQDRIAEVRPAVEGPGLRLVRGEAVGVLEAGARRGVRLMDGRQIDADMVVLSTGNLPPRAPLPADAWLQDHPAFVPDPWAKSALTDLDPDAPVLLLGTGLTMVDIALRLADEGQRGPMLAISRRGLIPTAHKAGGVWAPFLAPMLPASPLILCKAIRQAADQARRENLPWQRVMDAVRPSIARAWQSWSEPQKRQFLRHLRPRWDVHRHRMAPRVAARLDGLLKSGALTVVSGRLQDWTRQGNGVAAILIRRGGAGAMTVQAGCVINCTGPRSDLEGLPTPLFLDLSRRGLILPDRLGLGLESDDCAVLDAGGRPSSWLYAVGPLTRPALWEITAVPEITAQLDRLSLALSRTDAPSTADLAETFVDMGAGI